jgi:hypothetical protein
VFSFFLFERLLSVSTSLGVKSFEIHMIDEYVVFLFRDEVSFDNCMKDWISYWLVGI